MKTTFIVIAMLVFSLGWHCAADPLPGSVQLKVTKKSKKDRETIARGQRGHYSEQEIDDTVTYTIELTNRGNQPLNDVRVTWAVLLDARGRHGGPAKGGESQVVEGEKTITVAATKTFSFETEPIKLTEWQRGVTSAGKRGSTGVATTGSSIEGYTVEAYQGGKLLVSEFNPQDIKKRVDEAKQAPHPNGKR